MTKSSDVLQQLLGYQFHDVKRLDLALTHRSVSSKNNERLEFLGDAVLGVVITDNIFHRFPKASEGELTRTRANLVKKTTLAKLARKFELGDYIVLGPGEKKSGGWRRDSTLSNTMEAIIGAVYLDSDFEQTRDFILGVYTDLLNDLVLSEQNKDPKTQLQEYLQARKLSLPDYQVIDEQGLAHERQFTVECSIEGISSAIIAAGKSKQAAEQAAAENALKVLQSQES